MIRILEPRLRLDPNLTIGDLQAQFCELLRAARVRFVDVGPEGRDVPAEVTVSTLRGRPLELRASFPQGLELATEAGSRSPTEPDPSGQPVVEPTAARLIRELDILEQKRPGSFVWVGYVLKELLPAVGLVELEAKTFLDRLQREGVLLLSKVPNRKNPEFPATRVLLNREHPVVRSALNRARAVADFDPVPIRGEPASATLIRERR